MNVQTLTDIGLNETQAKVYILLVKNGSLTPPQTASLLSIKRTNAYAVLDKLEELGLASKKELKKKITYWAANPIALEKLARAKRTEALEHEKQVQSSMPALLNYFYSFSEQPGVRFFQGLDGIKEIYKDMLRTNKDVFVVRSAHDQDIMGDGFFADFKRKKAKQGICTHMLNPDVNSKIWNPEVNTELKTTVTETRLTKYSAKVEISTYGNKVSIISFGEEVIGMIIDSPQIAEAHRQLFKLAVLGASS